MGQVKLSVSLSPSEVAVLGKYVQSAGLKSRLATIQQATKLLGDPNLEDVHTTAWQEWEGAGEAEAWVAIVVDGVK